MGYSGLTAIGFSGFIGFKVFRFQGQRIGVLGDFGTRYVERETCWLLWGLLGHDGPGENGFWFVGVKATKNIDLRWTPRPVIVTIRDNKDHIQVLLYSYYTTITGWGVLLI